MLLSELLTPDRVIVPLAASDKEAALAELARHLVARCGGTFDDVLAAVREREEALSTGIGDGVAIPHARAASVPELSVIGAVAAAPIPYDSADGQPVTLLFLIVGPESSAGLHVKVLSRIARLMRVDGLRQRLTEARTPEEFLHTLRDAEER